MSARWDVLRRSFWFLPGLAMALGLALGFTLPELDAAASVSLGTLAFSFGDVESARGILETIATVTVSVAGIAFSVTVVALTLASQQLSPRVLRTFQANRLSQATLAVFVGTFVYCLVLLSSIDPGTLPELSLTAAIVMAVAAFALFVWFIHDIVNSLQASTIIRRIAADGQHAVAFRYPAALGNDPEDADAATRTVRERTSGRKPVEVRADRAGFLVSVEGDAIMEAARPRHALVVQVPAVGDFVVTGGLLAEAYREGDDRDRDDRAGADRDDDDDLVGDIRAAFTQEDERTVVQDVAFPIRQLADVALRGLSPSLNDPTTAENAMNSLADTLISFIRAGRAPLARVDDDGAVRFVAAAPDLDDLVRLGFDQVRVKAASYPVVSMRLLRLLQEVGREARTADLECSEVERQARLVAEGVQAPTDADVRAVRSAHASIGTE